VANTGIALELTGRKFNRLLVLERVAGNVKHKSFWLCLCDCGKTKIVQGYYLTSGTTKSCGCLRKETTSRLTFKHGMRDTSLFDRWAAMIKRCENPNDTSYKNYGARGISVCEEWHSFESF
jgi:hypothetical protein